MNKRFLFIIPVILILFSLLSFPLFASDDQKEMPVDSTKAVPADQTHWFKIVQIYHPSVYTEFTIAGEDRASGWTFTRFYAYPSNGYYNLNRPGTSGGNQKAFVGDTLVFTDAQINAASSDVTDLLYDERFFVEVYFEPDGTSPFRNIRSTLSYYLFDDDFTDVPFGTGVVDFLAAFFTLLIFAAPFVVIVFLFGRVLRW